MQCEFEYEEMKSNDRSLWKTVRVLLVLAFFLAVRQIYPVQLRIKLLIK